MLALGLVVFADCGRRGTHCCWVAGVGSGGVSEASAFLDVSGPEVFVGGKVGYAVLGTRCWVRGARYALLGTRCWVQMAVQGQDL